MENISHHEANCPERGPRAAMGISPGGWNRPEPEELGGVSQAGLARANAVAPIPEPDQRGEGDQESPINLLPPRDSIREPKILGVNPFDTSPLVPGSSLTVLDF